MRAGGDPVAAGAVLAAKGPGSIAMMRKDASGSRAEQGGCAAVEPPLSCRVLRAKPPVAPAGRRAGTVAV